MLGCFDLRDFVSCTFNEIVSLECRIELAWKGCHLRLLKFWPQSKLDCERTLITSILHSIVLFQWNISVSAASALSQSMWWLLACLRHLFHQTSLQIALSSDNCFVRVLHSYLLHVVIVLAGNLTDLTSPLFLWYFSVLYSDQHHA